MRTRFSFAIVALFSGPALAQDQTLPPIDTQYDSQLGGAYDPAPGVGIVSRDRTAPPAAGLYSICYVNAFQTQPDETAWWMAEHPDLLLHRGDALFEDENWPGEYLLDISTDAKREALAAIVGEWIDRCAQDGFQAVEADNLDTWTRSDGLITKDDAIDYATLLARRAHDNDLAMAQKNAPELGWDGPVLGFDFVIAEQCAAYDECAAHSDIYGDYVLRVEYDRGAFAEACARRGPKPVTVLRDRMLAPAGAAGHIFEAC